MKQIRRCVSILLACMCLLTSTAFASENASDQIVAYSIYVEPAGDGQIGMEFSISARGFMEEIGAESITIYEITPTGRKLKADYTKDDPGMIATDAWVHLNTFYFDGVAGKTYYVTVTVFATDYDGGSDSRTKSFTVTAT